VTKGQFFVALCRACLKKEGLTFLALVASVAGAGILCGLLAWNIAFLQEQNDSASIAWLSYGLLATVALVIFTLMKLLAGKQAIEAELWQFKFKASQGEDDVAPKAAP
jgi:hypothetical protein